ncbi:Translation initiation factor 2 [Minicystis rosea]|nr:Translation initiation factor 2 [Minicystis rosea]
MVFCGECGTPMTNGASPSGAGKPGASTAPLAGADRVARMPPAPASVPPPSKPIIKGPLPAKADTKPADAKPADASRPTRPSDLDTRRTVMGMPAAATPAAAPPPEPSRPGRRDNASSGKRSRKGSVAIPLEPSTADETEKMLEALDAGFDSIVRPSELPTVPITPSVVPELPRPLSEPGPVVVASDIAAAVEAATFLAIAPAEPALSPSSAPHLGVEPASSAPDAAAIRAQHESDMAEVRALFTELAIAHARPLRDFMIEVSWGDPTREWLDIATPACTALRNAADALEMPDLGAALVAFAAALELCAGEGTIGRDARDLLLGAYAKLAELMPAAFALEGERGRREPIIVRSLLLQVPGVQKVALDKIYAAGLSSLEMFYAAGPREIADTTGLDLEVTTRIHDRFQRYRKEIAQIDPGQDRAAERAEMATLLATLKHAHDEHEKLARAWTSDAATGRVRARKERNDTWLLITVLLARMGEVDRLRALEKVPFAQKIRDLEAFLDEAKRKASRP